MNRNSSIVSTFEPGMVIYAEFSFPSATKEEGRISVARQTDHGGKSRPCLVLSVEHDPKNGPGHGSLMVVPFSTSVPRGSLEEDESRRSIKLNNLEAKACGLGGDDRQAWIRPYMINIIELPTDRLARKPRYACNKSFDENPFVLGRCSPRFLALMKSKAAMAIRSKVATVKVVKKVDLSREYCRATYRASAANKRNSQHSAMEMY